MFFVLLFAGHETTTNLIGTGTYELLRHHDQWDLLCADPGLLPNAVEELVRFVAPVQYAERYLLEDTEVAGVRLPAGTSVNAALASANRDPAVFDDPERLDVRRAEAGRHLAFGFGTHFCLGAHLARLEGRIALAELTRRFPAIELATDAPEWRGAPMLRGLAALPVTLGAS
jgi:cytochrome P450